MDRYVRVFLSQALNALGSGDQAEKFDACCTPLLEHFDRRGCRAAYREHLVEEQAQSDVRLVWEFVVVRDGLERLVVAVEAEVPDPRGRNHLEYRVDHPEPGPQDRHQPDPIADLDAVVFFQLRHDRSLAKFQVGRRLVDQELRYFTDELPELLRLSLDPP